jgi:inner membrane protein
MDPLTQGALGAALAQAAPTKTKNIGIAGGLGFLSGMAADLDILIRSSTDPLLILEYHRHFTHSLVFIPAGALLVALAIHYLMKRRWQLRFFQTFVFCTLGYATHALLDASTSYGTRLFWPFSDERIAWGFVPIIDPLFTGPLIALCVVSILRQSPRFAWAGILWVGIYLSLGALQHSAALAMGNQIAASRGHSPIRFEVKPSFANILVWKIIYETAQDFYVDAARIGIGPRKFYGTSIPKLDLDRDFPWLDANTQQARDIQRFRFFSKGFVAVDPERPNRIMDIRYSLVPTEIKSLWSIEVSPYAEPAAHVIYRTHRDDVGESADKLWQMLLEIDVSH